MKKIIKSGLLALCIALTACSNPSTEAHTSALTLQDISSTEAATEAHDTNEQVNDSQKDVATERMIVKEGHIRFESGDTSQTRGNIISTIKKLNGYISQDSSTEYNNRTEHTLVVRIPAENFDSLLEGVAHTAKKVNSKSISALDVTEEFIDVQARIKAKKEIETRYIELLKKANSVEDILKIESELGTLRADIESFEGRLKYLKNRVTLSTLTVTFYEKAESTTGFGYKMSTAFESGWDYLIAFFIGVVHLWPFIFLSLLAVVIIRLIRKRKKKNKMS